MASSPFVISVLGPDPTAAAAVSARFEEALDAQATIIRDGDGGRPSRPARVVVWVDDGRHEPESTVRRHAGPNGAASMIVVVQSDSEAAPAWYAAGAASVLRSPSLDPATLVLAVEHALHHSAATFGRITAGRDGPVSSEERLRLAAQAARFGTYDFDIERREAIWSAELASIFGRPEQRRAHQDEIFGVIHPDDRAAFEQLVAEAVRPDGPGRHEGEYRVVCPNGEVRWVRDAGQTVFVGEGPERRPVRVVGLFHDITDRKEAELALVDSDRRKDEFIATLAHELRNPLAPIRTGIDLMSREHRDAAVLQRARRAMARQVHQLTRLVDDLVDISRVSRGVLELRKSPCSLVEVVDTAVEAVRHEVDAKGHVLHVDPPPSSLVLEADAVRLAQIFSNLLHNAAKYTPAGGTISFEAEQDANGVAIRVRDTGPGIPEHWRERVFDRFRQVDSPERGGSGLGIGLTLVRSLVELHGGTARILDRALGPGTEVEVRLPASMIVSTPDASEVIEASDESTPRRVLVVDDNEDVVELLSLALERRGHHVRTAGDGAQAVRVAEAFRPNLVLMDLGMPVLNGYEAARSIRKTEWGYGMTLVAVTGWGHREDREKTRAAGFDYHLVKPVDIETLQSLIRNAPAGPGSADA